MARLSNPPPHRYSGAGHDRAAHRRLDAAWLGERLADAGTRVILMSGLEVLVSADDEPAPLLLTVAELGRALSGEAIFLGEHEGAPLFAAELSETPPPSGRFVEVRAVGPRLQAREAGWLAYARALAHWHARHRFCGVCGGSTVSEQGGHVRRCEGCGAQHFPRSDPAVIVLVTHEHPEFGARCLLGRSARFPAGMYSTLAGFVEPGEFPRGDRPPRDLRGGGRRARGPAVPLIAALAVPGLADAGLPCRRAQRPAADRSRGAGRCRLVHARAATRPRAPADPAAQPGLRLRAT